VRYVECEGCGLTPGDLPDGVDPEFIFESVEGHVYCITCEPIAVYP
jgi:hypothetical protein